jgi:hypothetical protein
MENFSENGNSSFHATNLFVAVFALAFVAFGYGMYRTLRQDVVNQELAQSQNEQSLEFVQEDIVPASISTQICKSGYNVALRTEYFSAEWIRAAKAHSMSHIVSILYTGDAQELSQAKELINQAGANQIIPIFRLCDANSSCSNFKNKDFTIEFINKLKQDTNDHKFVFVAGPNEPITEKWLVEGITEFQEISAQEITDGQADQELFKKYFRYIAQEYTNPIGQAFAGDSQVIISGPIFNFDAAVSYPQYLQEYVNYLDVSVKAIAGNLYDVSNIDGQLIRKASDVYSNVRSITNAKNLNVYITEFGAFIEGYEESGRMPVKDNLKLSFQQLTAYSEIQSINFFNPFGANSDSRFSQHALSSSEIGNITGCSVDESFVPQEVILPGGEIKTRHIYVPYAKYYEPTFKAWEIKSCEISQSPSKTDVNFSVKLQKLESLDIFVGGYMMSAKVENFPELNHYGSTSTKVGNHDKDFGTQSNPFIPICNIVASFFAADDALVTHEHAGLLNLYSKNKTSNIAVPKLGSGIGCLNLLSVGLNNQEVLLQGSVAKDYRGFDISILSDDEYKQSLGKGLDLLTEQDKRLVVYVIDFFNNVSDEWDKFLNWITGGNTYKREILPDEPYIEYKTVEYCKNGPFEVRNLNTVANSDGESVSSEEQIAFLENIRFDFQNDFCNNFQNFDKNTYTFKVNGIRVLDLDGLYQKKCVERESLANLQVEKLVSIANDDIPTEIGIPGGLSGFGKLFEYLQAKIADEQRLILGQNGTEIAISYKFYDTNGINPDFLDEDKIEFDESIFETVKIEPESFGPFGSSLAEAKVAYILPMDLSPLLRALAYNFNQSQQSDQFFIEYNRHLGEYLDEVDD